MIQYKTVLSIFDHDDSNGEVSMKELLSANQKETSTEGEHEQGQEMKESRDIVRAFVDEGIGNQKFKTSTVVPLAALETEKKKRKQASTVVPLAALETEKKKRKKAELR